jgi:hypothetical protein
VYSKSTRGTARRRLRILVLHGEHIGVVTKFGEQGADQRGVTVRGRYLNASMRTYPLVILLVIDARAIVSYS